MALSSFWFLLFFQTVSWHLHVRFMADSSRIHRGFMPVYFNPKKSKSCQIHGTFMAVSWHFHIQALPGYSLPKSIGKSYPKSRCWLSIWFFLPNFSFIFGNMSDSCRFHGPFMALSSFWFLLFFPEKIQTNNWIHLKTDRLASMSDSSQIHRGFMALSCHFHGTFLSASQHVGFIADSCHFHGSFMALSHTSLTWVQSAKIYWKSYPKSRCWLSIRFFCLISASFLAICQIHVGFMAISWHFHGAFFLLIFIVFPSSFMALAWQIHGRFMALSWRFHGTFLALSCTFPFGHVCMCHEFAMKVPWICQT